MIELPILDAAEATDESSRMRFWRSFSHLRKDPDFQKIAQQEFMPGALDEPGGATRRQFLQLMGASVALAGLTGCRKPVQTILPYTRKPEEVIPGIPMYYATAMPFRGVLRPLLVESHEGRPTKVEGNPEHPASMGASGVFEQASVLTLYDPDRSARVLREGSEASWQDFVNFAQQFAAGAQARRLAVLCEPTSSPTLLALRDRLAQRFGQVDWVTYEAAGDDAEALGYQQAFGRPVRPHYRFSEAEVIVSFDADFLGPTARNYLADTREFAASRRLEAPGDAMSRFYIVESTYTNTGSAADHRLRLRASEVPAFAAAVAARLGVPGAGSQGAAFADHPYVAAIADDLRRAGARGVVLAGETQPAVVHALCAAINSALGAVGTTVRLLDTGVPATPSVDALRALVGRMRAGDVDALLMIGVNPVYDAPADLDFAGALQQVPQSIHLGLHVDETARASRWHLPRAHYLEAWGDGRSYDGTLSVIQPLIAPLYDDAHSEIEVVNVLATGLDESGYDLVRARWRSVIPGNFEEGWRRVLHDGFLPGTAYPAVTAAAGPVALSGLPQPREGLEVVFRLDPTVLDGSFANNGWCQELPDPVTKIVWDNVAVMSPATAEALGVVAEYRVGRYEVDRIDLSVNGQTVNLPVWIVPGHPDDAITVNLGYGRDIASNRPRRVTGFFDLDDYTDVYGQGHAIATGVGVNVAVLRTADSMHVAQGATARPTGETYTIVTTQDHGSMEGRPLVRMTDLETFRANPDYMLEQEPTLPGGEPWTEYPEPWAEDHPREQPAYHDNPYYKNQWGMVIDLNACTGCNACIVACNSENNIQIVGKTEVGRGRELHWLRLDRYFVTAGEDDVDNPQMVMQPLPCQHCENAPCESVCPVAATVHSPDGTNQMIYNRCIGTRYCSNNCPYKVRRYNWFNWTKTLPITLQMAQNPNVTVRSRGVMEKCSYCIQRVREVQQRAGLEDRPILDGEVKTACQQACPAQAISFGDLNNPDSEVVRWKQNPRRYEMLAYLNVKPRTSYLGRVRNPHPSLEPTEA